MKGNIFFPVSIDINNKNCLVVGAGKIALKKVKKLLEYGAKVELISPEILTEFYNLKLDKKVLDKADTTLKHKLATLFESYKNYMEEKKLVKQLKKQKKSKQKA